MHQKKASLKFIETCYRLYEQKMYQIAYSILHDAQLAEDAVQDAFLKLMRHSIYFEDAESNDSKRYMITVIKHAAIDLYRKKQKEQEMMYLSDQMAEQKQEEILENSADDADLKELIAHLPPKYQAVVQYLALKNLSVRETARKLHITEANVRKRFERAKKLLKKTVKGCDLYETGS